MELYQELAQIKSALPELQQYCLNLFDNHKYILESASGYAEKRREIHVRRLVRTRDNFVRTLSDKESEGLKRLEQLGDRLFKKIGYEQFDHALLLEYLEGGKIDLHGDSPAYFGDKNSIGVAISVEVVGSADFIIGEWKDKPKSSNSKYWNNWEKGTIHSVRLEPGSVLAFQNKQPHGVKPVSERRIVICYFKLKPEYLIEKQPEVVASNSGQLPLFNLPVQEPEPLSTVGVAHYATPGAIYIGRGMKRLNLPHSEFHNPFKVTQYGREECLRRFKEYFFSRRDLIKKLPTIRGKLLGCHKDCCQGKVLPIPTTYEEARCHGQILLLAAEQQAVGTLELPVVSLPQAKAQPIAKLEDSFQPSLLQTTKSQSAYPSKAIEDLTGKTVEVFAGRYLEPGIGVVICDRKDILSHMVEVKMLEAEGVSGRPFIQVVPSSHYRVVIEQRQEVEKVAVLTS